VRGPGEDAQRRPPEQSAANRRYRQDKRSHNDGAPNDPTSVHVLQNPTLDRSQRLYDIVFGMGSWSVKGSEEFPR
jgi:hypothetical protein